MTSLAGQNAAAVAPAGFSTDFAYFGHLRSLPGALQAGAGARTGNQARRRTVPRRPGSRAWPSTSPSGLACSGIPMNGRASTSNRPGRILRNGYFGSRAVLLFRPCCGRRAVPARRSRRLQSRRRDASRHLKSNSHGRSTQQLTMRDNPRAALTEPLPVDLPLLGPHIGPWGLSKAWRPGGRVAGRLTSR